MDRFLYERLEEAKKKKKKKKKASRRPNVTYTTGYPGLNMARFNGALGGYWGGNHDDDDVSDNDFGVPEADGDAGGDFGGGDGGGMGESLTLDEAKREVRRYYIRPQNIFCANKKDVLKALIDMEDQNCSVYTLNNLGDDKDVTKLTNKDIIYYYDDGILYDKNKIKVMDYDLYIRHEEERPLYTTPVEQVAKVDFKQDYEDRATAHTLDEE